jgi:hypothetical protein
MPLRTIQEHEELTIKWVQNMSRAIAQENSELLDSTPWKWWSKYQTFDKDNA